MKIWKSNRRTLLGLMLSSASALPSIAFAQTQAQPLEIILPFGAGSNIEKLLKTTAPILEKELGRPIQIKLVPGEGGAKGLSELLKSSPQDPRIAFVPPRPLLVNPRVGQTTYQLKDFQPIAQLGVFYTGLVVPADSKWQSIEDFIRDAKRSPATLTYASGGEYSLAHLAMEAFLSSAQLQVKHAPYDNGNVAVQMVLKGQADITMTDLQSQFGNDQKTRVLAIASPTRVNTWPSVPTLSERGHPMNFDVWQGFIATQNTPVSLIADVENALNKVTQMADFKTTVTSSTGATVQFMNAKDWAAKWRQEDQVFSQIIAQLKSGK
jgi:tripartite-type tricarboxylate transporter receptor subunit TctC